MTPSFAAVIMTKATRGQCLTRNVDAGCNKLLYFSRMSIGYWLVFTTIPVEVPK